MAPKLNKIDSSLEAANATEHKRKSGNSSEIKVRKKEKIKPFGLVEREVKHLKITSAKELYDAYTFGSEIGKGTFGTVMAVVDKSTNRNWAMKIISKPVVNLFTHKKRRAAGKKIKYVHNELRILKMVDHPHIIHLEKVFETEKKIYLVLERCIGELGALLKERGTFKEADARKVLSELCEAVAYLHRYDIVHRDLKLENILLARNPQNKEDEMYIKVADFGLSAVKTGVAYTDMLKDHCGTLMYMSPEMLTSFSYSQQCDIWSMGVILFLLLSGRYPFYSKDEEKLVKLICAAELDFDYINFINDGVSAEAKDLISKMLVKNPAVRLTASEVLQHPWTTGNVMSGQQAPANVLEMMRMWKSELATSNDDDWLAAANVPRKQMTTRPITITDETQTSQYIEIPKTNIEFDRTAHRRCKDESIEESVILARTKRCS